MHHNLVTLRLKLFSDSQVKIRCQKYFNYDNRSGAYDCRSIPYHSLVMSATHNKYEPRIRIKKFTVHVPHTMSVIQYTVIIVCRRTAPF